MILGFGDTTSSAYGAHGGNWPVADVPVDSHFDFRASLPQKFDAICKLSRSANDAVPEIANGVFGLGIQNQILLQSGTLPLLLNWCRWSAGEMLRRRLVPHESLEFFEMSTWFANVITCVPRWNVSTLIWGLLAKKCPANGFLKNNPVLCKILRLVWNLSASWA